MRPGRLAFFATLSCLLVAGPSFASAPILDEPEISGRSCGVDESGPLAVAPEYDQIQKWIRDNRIAAGGVVPVYFHVIYYGSKGNVPASQLDAQIQVLNNNFAGKDYDGNPVLGAANTGYTFFNAGVDRTSNRRWFSMTPGSKAEFDAKKALAIGPASALNLYTCSPGQGLLGWAVFPWDSRAKTNQDGIVVHYRSLPGGTLSPYNLGGTASHEAGHWLGLYHTFQGGCTGGDAAPGCTAGGDLVCDTPAEATSTSGCPSSKDTCSGGGPDPTHNYMDYSDDACYTQFTLGQDARMDWAVSSYRPLIGAAKPGLGSADAIAAAGAAVDMAVSPNPFNPTTTIDFSLSRAAQVSLRVYDVAGRSVATLVEGTQQAGNHRAVFDGAGVASGMYLAVLEVDGVRHLARLVLLK